MKQKPIIRTSSITNPNAVFTNIFIHIETKLYKISITFTKHTVLDDMLIKEYIDEYMTGITILWEQATTVRRFCESIKKLSGWFYTSIVRKD